MRRSLVLLFVFMLSWAAVACVRSGPPDTRPNILWVVWDTVRADHTSLYGYSKATTPHLASWAKNAVVFDDCLSAATTTVPSHASMFTGLLPSEHGANNAHQYLDSRHVTIAEILERSGYQTYLWSSNPHISRDEGFNQGFEVEEHPWDPANLAEARRIVEGKISGDRSSELPERMRAQRPDSWAIKASGELAQRGLLSWLKSRDSRRPYFAFLNYMEAHRPLIPPREYRRRMMSPEQVEHSYQADFSWDELWAYDFKLREYSESDLESLRGTYDAAILELDDLFATLLDSLSTQGLLTNTIVVLTADHGEHLGEHHLLDHQYSAYEQVIRVPLVLYAPSLPGRRENRPVMTHDLFATLLALSGTAPPTQLRPLTLLKPSETRERLAEYPAAFDLALSTVKAKHPEFDPAPWRRTLRAFTSDHSKLIWASDGRHELYDIGTDQAEARNLFAERPDVEKRMSARLGLFVNALQASSDAGVVPAMSAEQRERLRALGYSGN